MYGLLPPLLFESAFNVNYHVFVKVVKPSVLLATTGVSVSVALTACCSMLLFKDQFDRIQYENPLCSTFGLGPSGAATPSVADCSLYAHSDGHPSVCPDLSELSNQLGRDEHGACPAVADAHRRLSGGGDEHAVGCYDCSMDGWWASLMFASIVSATDPVAVVAVLQSLGAQPKLGHMIEGESLLNDGSAVVIFMVFRGLVLHEMQESGSAASKMIALVMRLAGGGVVCGWLSAQIVYWWLRFTRNLEATIEISIMVLSVYMVFYVSEHVCGASGVLATVVYGLQLARRRHLALTVATDEHNEVVWEEIGYVANSFTFALAGVIFWRIISNVSVGDVQDMRFMKGEQTTKAVILYFLLAAVRLTAIGLHYHIMRACTSRGYQVQWKEIFFMTYAGLRGAVSLCVALFVDHMEGVPQLVKDVIIFHTCLCVFFTVFFNGISAGWAYKCLRLGRQGRVRGEVDAGSVQLLEDFLDKELVDIADHWFHGEHNSTKVGIYAAKSLLSFELLKDNDSGMDLAPISDKGELRIEKVQVSKLWSHLMTNKARVDWRSDPLHNAGSHHGRGKYASEEQNEISEDMVRQKIKWCYTPSEEEAETDDSHDLLGGAEGVVKVGWRTAAEENASDVSGMVGDLADGVGFTQMAGLVNSATSALGVNRIVDGATRRLGINHLAPHLPHRKKYILGGSSDPATAKSAKQDVEGDMYSIYLSAIRAHYDEEHEECKLSATTYNHLCSANASALDFVTAKKKNAHKTAKVGEASESISGGVTFGHDELKATVEAFNLSDYKTSPPIHKLQTMTEAYFVEYEVHKAVAKFLHAHLGGELTETGAEVHERIRSECNQVCTDAMHELATWAYQHHTVMPVVHASLAFHRAVANMTAELKALKVHGLMSGACFDELTATLSTRLQDLNAVISDDGAQSKLLEFKEWFCVRLCKRVYDVDSPTQQELDEAVQRHAAEFEDLDVDHSGALSKDELKVAVSRSAPSSDFLCCTICNLTSEAALRSCAWTQDRRRAVRGRDGRASQARRWRRRRPDRLRRVHGDDLAPRAPHP